MNIVMITTGSRPRLLEQSLRSLRENAYHWDRHQLTLVMDGCSVVDVCTQAETVPDCLIINPKRKGASRSRNIGASSTPGYLRQDAVMFVDDDVYGCPGWDSNTTAILGMGYAVSGYAHPFNHTYYGAVYNYNRHARITNVLSTVHIACLWPMWDSIGFFAEPGGPGGSEDVDWCARATRQQAGLAVTNPQRILHTGIGSTSLKPLIGWEQVMENNQNLEIIYGIMGKVVYE